MINYEKMYKILFNGITDAVYDIENKNFGLALNTLVKIQQETEEIYIGSENAQLSRIYISK